VSKAHTRANALGWIETARATTFQARRSEHTMNNESHSGRSSAGLRLALAFAGIAGILGGEAFCILGPIRYERFVYITCHAIFYIGVACVVVSAFLHWTRHPRR